MLTEYQLEIAARELCRIRGVKPEQEFSEGFGHIVKRWQLVALEIRDHLQMRWAIDLAAEQRPAETMKLMQDLSRQTFAGRTD